MGNKAGWLVAGGLILVVGVVVGYLIIAPTLGEDPSKPTIATTGAGALDFKDVEIPPTKIVGPMPTGAGNAADDYAKAVGIYKSNKGNLDRLIGNLVDGQSLPVRFAKMPKLSESDVAIIKQIDDNVSAGTSKAKMDFVLTHTPKDLKPGWHYAPAYELVKVGKCLDLLAADCVSRKDYASAEKILHRKMILGWHMMQERARACVTWLGQDMQMLTIDRLRRDVYAPWDVENLKGQQGPSDKFKQQLAVTQEYFSKLDTFGQYFTTKMKILLVAKPQPGDVFNIVENDKDRAWRVQGILTLGIVKFSSTPGANKKQEEANHKYAQKLIDKYLKSSDPLEAAAAAGAQAFTAAQLETYATDDKAE